MNILMDDYLLFAIIFIGAVATAAYFIATFLKLPKKQQLKQLKEWLLYAVARAEKELGGGTGRLKLRYVYDMFIIRFGPLSKIISFEAFSLLVDEVLEEFREILETNNSIANYVEGQNDK